MSIPRVKEEDLPEWRIRLEFNHFDLARSNPEGAFMDVLVTAHTVDAAAWLAQVMHHGGRRELAVYGKYVRIVRATRAWSQSGAEVSLDYDKLARRGWTE